MAQGSNEHRMVFDIRGRRRHVVKFVYAILAILMAASLFLVTGAININSILGTGSSGESAASSFEKQAANIEAKLRKSPGDEALLASLTRTRINVANAMITGGVGATESGAEDVKQQLSLASEDWSEYVAAASEPSAGIAVQVSPALFQLAQLSSGAEAALENIKAATEAQKIVAEARPSLNSLSTLGFYSLFAQEYKPAEKAMEEATKFATTKFERESLENKFDEYEKNAKEFGKQLKAEKATKSKSAGKETLENPLQGLGGTSLGGE
jgi:predicted O-linked N-acetylglucosamine transferase (SPINDLY family)